MTTPAQKPGLHPRNKNAAGYDFAALTAVAPGLVKFVITTKAGTPSIDFANPSAVKAFNRALLALHYGIKGWEIPAGYLCPPVPGRADYIHHAADLLATCNKKIIPTGAGVRVIDIGVGANCVYPLIGHAEYGWSFVGSDIDRAALHCAQATIDANRGYREAIELRWQSARLAVFSGVLQRDELFDLVMCNPPFHASLDDAVAGSTRKWQNLGQAAPAGEAPLLNFGGQGDELCCAGGEEGFIGRMIAESVRIPTSCLWFTTLVSKAANLPTVYRALKSAGVQDSRTIDMAQGQKKSRIVAWTYLTERQRQSWRNSRRADSARA